ncbi:F-box/SPRY domain-containing protein 1 [Planococcus citri]|uniref:F-box/SPRY domain-containing protein 1 n=1 Tax=Planococcus citri TaxID=170843 RepID=UPI0031F76134
MIIPAMAERDCIAAYLTDDILDILFTYLNLEDFKNCALVCRNWYRYFQQENSLPWRVQCGKILPEGTSAGILCSLKTCKSKVRAYAHAWNANDCSKNIFVKPDGFTLHRNPVAQSTDAIRAKNGFNHGRHIWEVKWGSPLGTVAVVGVATKDASLQCNGYVPLIGNNEYSWGWNLVENNLMHKGKLCGSYPLLPNAPKYEVDEKIRVILDCERGTLAFEKNHEFLGVAFKNLPRNKRLYPAVSAVYGNSEIIMIYLGEPYDG